MSSDPLMSSETLRIGDVVLVAVELNDKYAPGKTWWWKTFRAVVNIQSFTDRDITTLILRPHIDPQKDIREIDLTDPRNIVTRLEEKEWPQGVIAMRMKYIMQGIIQLDRDLTRS